MSFPQNLLGHRVEDFWVEALDVWDRVIEVCPWIELSSAVFECNADSRIMSAFKFVWNPPTLEDTERYDLYVTRFRPWVRINGQSWPLGVFVPNSDSRKLNAKTITTLDKTTLLDEVDTPFTYSVAAGTNIVQHVSSMIVERAREDYARVTIPPSDKTVDVLMTWPSGTSFLTIANDLLQKMNYTKLKIDGYGSWYSEPYVEPSKRPVVHRFEAGEVSIHRQDYEVTQDRFTVPNQVICITQGSDTSPALVSIVENTDLNSPYSIPNRGGRVISKTYEVEATDQESLDRTASRNLWNSSSPPKYFVVEHAKAPLWIDNVVGFKDGIDDSLAVVNEFSMNLSDGDLVKAKWVEISNAN